MRRRKAKVKTSVLITAIICIAAIELVALYLGHDGLILTTIVAIIAGLAGWTLPRPRSR